MSNLFIRFAAAIAVVATVSSLVACTSVLDTTAMDAYEPIVCANSAGAYRLPRKLITFTVYKSDGPGYGVEVQKELTPVADQSQLYCLDYISSVTSRDDIGILRNPEGLIQRIYTRTKDQTVEIAKTLIDTGLLLAAQTGRGLAYGSTEKPIGPFTFDPFDPEDAAKFNAELKHYGLCLFIEDVTFPNSVSAAEWCNKPTPIALVYKAGYIEPLPPPSESQRGVLYRPNTNHVLRVLRKSDPYGRNPWTLLMTRQIEAPNVAPTFVIEVKRSLFVDRVTDLEFDNGTLTNISIKKPSELAAFVEIPLYVARAAVALPGQIVKLKINEAKNSERLIRAQAQLLQVRQQYRDEIKLLQTTQTKPTQFPGLQGDPPTGSSGDGRLAADPLDEVTHQKYLGNCVNTGMSPSECESQWRNSAR